MTFPQTLARSLLLRHIQINIAIHIHILHLTFCTHILDLGRLGLIEPSSEMSSKLLHQQWDTLLSSELVSNGVFHRDLIQGTSILHCDEDGISNRALLGIVVLSGEGLVLNTLHLCSKLVDTRISCNRVVVVQGSETAKDEWDGNHVLYAVVSVSIIVQGSLLVDDSDSGLLCPDADGLDVFYALSKLLELVVEGHGCLAGSLGVEFGGIRDFEEDVLHHIASVWALEFELFALEENVVETPYLGGKDGFDSLNTAVLDHEGEVYCSGASITCSP